MKTLSVLLALGIFVLPYQAYAEGYHGAGLPGQFNNSANFTIEIRNGGISLPDYAKKVQQSSKDKANNDVRFQ